MYMTLTTKEQTQRRPSSGSGRHSRDASMTSATPGCSSAFSIKAESVHLQGYQPLEITPAEAASGGKVIQCGTQGQACAADFKFSGAGGSYEIDVQYFDMPVGNAKYRLLVGDKVLDAWTADDHLPARSLGGDSSVRRTVSGVALRKGDVIRIEGTPGQKDPAALDYVEIRSTAQVAATRVPIPVYLTTEQ